MFLELKPVDVDKYPAGFVVNTDQIVYYFERADKTTRICFFNGGGIEFNITKEELNDILSCNIDNTEYHWG